MVNIVNYSNSSRPICIDLQLGQGCGLDPSRNDTFIDVGKLILSELDDVLITTKPTDITQLTSIDIHDRPFSIPLLDGSTVTVWQCGSGAASEICAAKYDKNNNRILAQRTINTNTSGVQSVPKGALLSDGRLLINWQDSTKAKAKVFFSDLSTSIDEFYITSTSGVGGTQLRIAQAILSDGRAVFLVENLVSPSRVIINGTFLDVDTQTRNSFTVSASTVGSQQGPDIAALSDDGFVGVWHGNIQGNSFLNIFMRRFDGNGTPVGVETVLTADDNGAQISPFVGDQTSPKVAVNDGRVCVIWECSLQGRSLSDICLNVYDLGFVFIKTFTPFNNYNPNNNRDPYIVSLSSGGFRAAWRSQDQGSVFNLVLTVLLDDAISKVGGESRVNTNSDFLSNTVRVTASSLNGYGSIITWVGSNNIFYRKYNSRVVVEARGGDDHIVASGMGDILDCGSGSMDNVSYAEILSPCTIDLTTGKGCGDDLVYECENIICPKVGCNVTANGGNIIYGAAGNDFITVMGLPIVVHGNGGNDGISFKFLNSPVNVTRGVGTAGNNNIMFNNISTIIGSDHKDGDYIVDGGTIYGGDGPDTVVAILPAIIDGGPGVNTVSFELSTNPVICDLTANTATDGINTATLTRIHNIKCSPSGGTYSGNALNNIFYPGAGIDYISGMGGTDKVSYQNSPGPVVVDLMIGRGQDKDGDNGGDARGDTYSGIGDVVGSPYDDVLIGANNRDNTVLDGEAGKDILTPGNGGLNTVLIGGAGSDIFKFGNFQGSATIRDFKINEGEKLDLTDLTNIHSIGDFKEMRQAFNNTVITLSPGAQITLENVLMDSLTDAHFNFAPVIPVASSSSFAPWIVTMIFGVITLSLTGAITYYRWGTSKKERQAAELKIAESTANIEMSDRDVQWNTKLPGSAVDEEDQLA